MILAMRICALCGTEEQGEKCANGHNAEYVPSFGFGLVVGGMGGWLLPFAGRMLPLAMAGNDGAKLSTILSITGMVIVLGIAIYYIVDARDRAKQPTPLNCFSHEPYGRAVGALGALILPFLMRTPH
jgi:hypothetical protein